MRTLLPVPLIGVLVLCLYGFTTTFEPMERGIQLTYRIAYAAGVFVCSVALGLLLTASIRADARRRDRLD